MRCQPESRLLRAAGLAMLLSAAAVAPGPAAAAGSGTLVISAVVLSNSNCRFGSNAPSALHFAVDPSSASNVSVSTTRTFRCGGSAPTATFSFTTDGGLYGNRMRHATDTNEFLPYSLNLSPASGAVAKNTDVTLTIAGTITPAQFRDAKAGDYSDTVVITLSP